jgi:hypothetical protein
MPDPVPPAREYPSRGRPVLLFLALSNRAFLSPGPCCLLFYISSFGKLPGRSIHPNQPANPNQSGIVFFQGSAALYLNGQMLGGLGVSSDGVDQDDFVTSGGAQNYCAPANIQASQIVIRRVRLPYWSFPKNPEQ